MAYVPKPSIKMKNGGRTATLDFMVNELKGEITKRSLNVIRRAALATANQIKGLTPVDTGRAAHNWTIGLNGYKKAEDVISSDGEVEQGFALALQDGDNIEYDPYGPIKHTPLLNMKITDKITINNETPYIRELENGHSKKAPQGMVRISLQMWPTQLKFATDEINSGMKWYDQ